MLFAKLESHYLLIISYSMATAGGISGFLTSLLHMGHNDAVICFIYCVELLCMERKLGCGLPSQKCPNLDLKEKFRLKESSSKNYKNARTLTCT